MVTFKKIEVGSAEFNLLEFLNNDCNRDDLWNHSVPVLDIVEHDGEAMIMMLRLRHFASPPFQNVAECLDFIRQLLEVCPTVLVGIAARLNLKNHRALRSFMSTKSRGSTCASPT